MYPELNAAMARKKMSGIELSEKTNIRYNTLMLKLAGKSKIELGEAIAIKAAVESPLTVEELFTCE